MEEKVKKKKKSLAFKITWTVVAVVFCAILAMALRYLISYNSFLDKITSKKPEMKEYSVLVENSSPVQGVSGLTNKSVGFLETDTLAAKAMKRLEQEVDIEGEFYEDLETLTGLLENKLSDAIVLETDRLEILKEEVEDTANKMRVIYTFEVEITDETEEVSTKEVTTEPFIIYISGSDSRNGLQATARSDVNIVAVVNVKEGKILLVSIPRDTYVQLHNTTGLKDKLTHAGVYGISMSKATIEDFLGIDIDHTLKVSFDTVVKVVDQLDGIEIYSDKAMTLGAEGGQKCEYVEGKQTLNGPCALRFARERKSYSTGDRHRGENQQQVITSIIGKLSSSRNYLFKIPTILDIAADSFETTLSRSDISAFVRMQLNNSVKWNVESISIDGAGTYEPTYSMGANLPLYVMIPSEDSMKNAQKKIREYLKSEPTQTEAEPSNNTTGGSE